MEVFFLMVLTKFVLKYIFVKLQDHEKETEFSFFLGFPTALVCIENHLFIVGIGPILNKEFELIFRSDHSDRTYVYSYVSVLYDKFWI